MGELDDFHFYLKLFIHALFNITDSVKDLGKWLDAVITLYFLVLVFLYYHWDTSVMLAIIPLKFQISFKEFTLVERTVKAFVYTFRFRDVGFVIYIFRYWSRFRVILVLSLKDFLVIGSLVFILDLTFATDFYLFDLFYYEPNFLFLVSLSKNCFHLLLIHLIRLSLSRPMG